MNASSVATREAALRAALSVVGDRWTLLVVDALLARRRHFRELVRHVDGIASNILADRLRLLSESGFVSKHRDPEHKQRALYELTERGLALAPVIAELAAWALSFQSAADADADANAGDAPAIAAPHSEQNR